MSINFSDATPAPPGGSANVKWQKDGSGNVSAYLPASAGTVTSVALSMPGEFAVTGSPVVGAGTFGVTKTLQLQNTVYCALPSGGTGAPSFRRLVLADMPAGVGAVASVFARTGAVVAAAGDYTAAQVTNAVSILSTYPDPPWISSLSWAKLTGVPASFPPAAHTHDASAIISGIVATARLGSGSPSTATYLRGDGSWAPVVAAGVTTVFGRSGVVAAQSGDYTVAQVTGAVPTTLTITSGAGLAGGGDLSANRTLSLAAATAAALGGVKIGANITVQPDGTISVAPPAAGGVTSVALAMPAEFTVTGSPVTGAGTLTAAKATQLQNLVYASPSGSSGVPVFRALTVADIPSGVGAVSSVFTRSGAVVATSGDYTAAQVTNAVSTLGSYADPAWITSLAWAKITGAPGSSYTLPVSTATVLGGVKIGSGVTVAGDGTISVAAGSIVPATATVLGGVKIGANITVQADGTISVAAPGGGSQTPWASDIDAASHHLNNVVGINLLGNGAGINGNSNASFNCAGNLSLGGNNGVVISANSPLTPVMTITPAGNVGIGTTGTPAAKLTINGVGSNGVGLCDMQITGSGTVGAGFNLNCTDTGGKNWAVMSFGSANQAGGFGFLDVTNLTYAMTVLSNYNVHMVGTLSVDGNINTNTYNGVALRLSNPGSYANIYMDSSGTISNRVIIATTSGNLRWSYGCNSDNEGGASSGSNFVVNGWDDSGNLVATAIGIKRATCFVGIGTASPAYRLDVAGDVNVSGAFRVNGVPIASGGGGTPGGLNTQFQYNNAGVFDGTSGFTWNGGTTRATIAGGVNAGYVAPVFISSASGGNVAFMTQALGFAVTGAGDIGALSLSLTTKLGITLGSSALTGSAGGTGSGNALLSATTAGLYLSVNGAAPGLIGSQTPWTQNINAAGFSLSNVGSALFKPSSGTLTVSFQDGVPSSTTTLAQSATLVKFSNNALPLEFGANTNGGATNQLCLSTSGNVGIGTAAPWSEVTIFSADRATVPTANQLVISSVALASYGLNIGYLLDTDNYRKGVIQVLNGTGGTNAFLQALLLNPSGGYVGLGTTMPATILEVAGHGNTLSGLGQITVRDLDNPSTGSPLVNFTGVASDGVRTFLLGNPGASFGKDLLIWNDRPGGTRFGTNGSERMRIDQSGNVGIGTNAPGQILNVSASGADTNVLIDVPNQSTYMPMVSFRVLTAAVWNIGIDTADFSKLKFATGGNFNNISAGGAKMTITTDGNVGIGTTAPRSILSVMTTTPVTLATATQFWICEATNNPGYGTAIGYFLDGSDSHYKSVIQNNEGAATGALLLNPRGGSCGIGMTNPSAVLHLGQDSAAKPSTSTWIVNSDGRLKRNITELTGGLENIMKLRPVVAEYNGQGGLPEGLRVNSFIAQEVLEAGLIHAITSHRGRLPDADGRQVETDVLDLNMHEIIMHLVLAVQQLAAGSQPAPARRFLKGN